MITAGLSGFVTGLSLILAIGAQNAFVLRQGLKGEHVLALCLFCSVSDTLLIGAGVFGFGAMTSAWPFLPAFMTYGGAAFLFFYGLRRFYVAWKGGETMGVGAESQTLGTTLALAAGFTWANPHVYLDTVALIGAVSTGFADDVRWIFGAGAMLSSFIFFFSLGYGARLLQPVMTSARAWQILDVLIGVTMWWIAASLVI